MDEIETHIKDWIQKVSKHYPELGGFSICPYALNSKFNINICNDINDIKPIEGYDIVFFVLSNNLSLSEIQSIVNDCNEKYQEWEFFEDCASYNTYINEIQTNNQKYNLILAQPKEKLKDLRIKLARTDYYKYWNDDYLKEILQEEYDSIKNIITG